MYDGPMRGTCEELSSINLWHPQHEVELREDASLAISCVVSNNSRIRDLCVFLYIELDNEPLEITSAPEKLQFDCYLYKFVVPVARSCIDPIPYLFRATTGGDSSVDIWFSSAGASLARPMKSLWWRRCIHASLRPRLGPEFERISPRPPKWFQGQQVFYQIFPDTFARGVDKEWRTKQGREVSDLQPWAEPRRGGPRCFEPRWGGDLAGVSLALPYLKDLGVTALYCTPVFAAPSNHHYDTLDFARVDEDFGGNQALRELCQAVHAQSMRILLDVSINHCSERHPWHRQAMSGNKCALSLFVPRLTRAPHDAASHALRPPVVEGGIDPDLALSLFASGTRGEQTSVSGDAEQPGSWGALQGFAETQEVAHLAAGSARPVAASGEYSCSALVDTENWRGYTSLRKLDLSNPLLAAAFWSTPRSLLPALCAGAPSGVDAAISLGGDEPARPDDDLRGVRIDGWRLDVAGMMGSGSGAGRNVALLQQLRRAIKSSEPEAVLMGEHMGEATEWLQGDAEDAAMNYAGCRDPVLAWCGQRGRAPVPASVFRATVETFRCALPWHMQLSQLNLLGSHDTPRLVTILSDPLLVFNAFALQFFLPGNPCIFYGDEVGLPGENDPFCRVPMPWTGPHPGVPASPPHDCVNGLSAFVRHLTQLRHEYECMRTGDLFWLRTEREDCLGLARVRDGEAVVLAVTRSKSPLSLKLDAPELLAILRHCSL